MRTVNHKSLRSVRDGFGDGVVLAAKENNDIALLTADLEESTKSQYFAKEFANRFFDVGVAEQNLAGIAAGLALSGKIPFITSYSVFSPGRNWDQVRVAVCISNANVKIASSHSGLSAGPDGATHQALEDIAITRVLPNMTVLVPCDYWEAVKATQAAAKAVGPVYLRLAKETLSDITTQKDRFEIGKATILNEGKDITIIGCGPILSEALKAAKELKEENNTECEVINCSTIKPLDTETILNSVKKTKKVLTIEEHQIHGGLGGVICELLAQEFPTKVKVMGMNDHFGESGTYIELLEKYNLTANHIKKEVIKLLQ